MQEGLGSNMPILIGGAMILMVIVMGVLFAYVRYRFMPLLLESIGLVTSLGLMGLASFPIISYFGITTLIAVGFSLVRSS
jgi:predicted RND superfamily exporter protein